MSIGKYVWKSAMDRPYVVEYAYDHINNNTKSFESIDSLKQWVNENKDIIVINGFYNNISGKHLDIEI